MIIYGRNPVREGLRGPRTVKRIWAAAGAAREPWLAQHANLITPTSAEELERLCGSSSHQGLCADVSPFQYAPADDVLGASTPIVVALDQVQDPQNLGSIARTAECAGAAGLVIPERRAAEVTPAVCKASAGAVEHIPVVQTRNLADFLAEAKRAGFWCYGADQHGSADYRQVDLSGPVVVVLGSEGRGLRPRVARACDAVVSIPLRGRIDSLSVGAAAAILIYAAAATRR